MPGLTLRQIDRKTGISGFGAALCETGWLNDDPQGVVIVRFEEHNGTSAKRRCTEAQRKANGRTVSASDADKSQTDGGHDADEIRRIAELEKEKRREEEKKYPPAARVPRATKKCPEAFVVTSELIAWAASEAPGVSLENETARMRDHTFKNAISDWQGAWRNWMRRASETKPPARASPAETFRERDERLARERYAEMTGRTSSAQDLNTIDMPGTLALENQR
jgi:hypothetical protein